MKVLIILLLLIPGILFPQSQDAKVLTYNIGFGGLTAGVGAVINKKEGENWRKTFARGFWQGSIGGALNYTAKKSTYLIQKNNSLSYAIPARIVNAAGNSIIQNAAANGPFLKVWNFEYGLFRFDYSAVAEDRFRVRLLPESIVASLIVLPQGHLDLSTTLCSGIITVKAEGMINSVSGRHDGVNYGRAFIYYEDMSRYHIISHEIIHEYQYREYQVFNAYWKNNIEKMDAPRLKKFFTKYMFPDVPYFGLFYMLEGVERSPHYYRNFYEFEAERTSTNHHVHVE